MTNRWTDGQTMSIARCDITKLDAHKNKLVYNTMLARWPVWLTASTY